MSRIAENFEQVRERIAKAALRAGRSPERIRLIAVTKMVPVDRIREAVEAGVTDFGENYVQEALPKIQQVGPGPRWHFIGHLQRNKARHVVGSFEMVHSLDSIPLADELQKRAAKAGITQNVLIEVRLDPAETKAGVNEEDLWPLIDHVVGQPNLRLCGLMGMPPLLSDPEETRPYFRQLRQLGERLPSTCGRELSMGMSHDFEVAIEEGATMVRVGTAIFGPRG